MALNPNHPFEDLDEVKCAVVEKNCTPERADFLKQLLEYNRFTVVIAKSPPPKVAAKPAAPVAEGEPEAPPPPPPPETFTVGVTDVTFSAVKAMFNRELKTFEGSIVTPDYWKQREATVKPGEWYWKK